MKVKIKLNDFNGKEIIKEINVSNKLHLEIQKNNKSQIYRNRKKYNRKIKHKNSLDFFFIFY